jgi:excisionase family DNA binding protein
MSDWLTYREAADALGISMTTLKRRIAAGHIRRIHPPGGHPRITAREVAAYRAAAEGA